MANGMLSQEEIDALLSGSANESSEPDKVTSQSPEIGLSDMEKDAIGEIANISMGTAATTLSQLVGKRVEITTPQVDLTDAKKIFKDYPVPHVLIDVKYKKGIEGSNMLVLSQKDGAIIVDLMMGGTGANFSGELTELTLSGISEAMNQMMGSAATSMSTIFNSVVDITPPHVVKSEQDEEEKELIKTLNTDEALVRVSFRLIIEGVIDSVLIQVMPLSVAKGMAAKLLVQMGKPDISPTEVSLNTPPPPPPEPSPVPQTNWEIPNDGFIPPPPAGGGTMGTYNQKGQPTFVEPARFAPLSPGGASGLPNNLELIYDVPLQVNVELGKATKTIKEILELGPGSVIELDRLAGEPVDMIVNGKLIAKCEVVVISETFGIRITEIINPNERIDTLN